MKKVSSQPKYKYKKVYVEKRNRNTDWCYYHNRFGSSLTHCRPPCTFTPLGNKQANRQWCLRWSASTTRTIYSSFGIALLNAISWLTHEPRSSSFPHLVWTHYLGNQGQVGWQPTKTSSAHMGCTQFSSSRL